MAGVAGVVIGAAGSKPGPSSLSISYSSGITRMRAVVLISQAIRLDNLQHFVAPRLTAVAFPESVMYASVSVIASRMSSSDSCREASEESGFGIAAVDAMDSDAGLFGEDADSGSGIDKPGTMVGESDGKEEG